MEGRDSFVVVTNREVYDAVMALKGEVSLMRQEVGSITTEQKDQGKRLGRLEFRYYAILAGLVTTLATVGVGVAGASGVL